MTQRDRVAVALDVGGTAIKCALVNPDGQVRDASRRPTGAERGPAAVVATIVALAGELCAQARAGGLDPVAIGVAIPGVVDEATGIARWSANLGLRDVP